MAWDPDQYERFDALRRRPAHDLVAALPSIAPLRAIDLGCGTGSLARLLADRWPDCTVTGLDSSASMLVRAAAIPSRVNWQQADVSRWTADPPVDLIISNAALQWLDNHQTLFPRLIRQLAPDGVLAVQMPRNFTAPSHQLLAETAANGPWADRLAGALRDQPVAEAAQYYDWLRPLCRSLDIWEVEYLQPLPPPVPPARSAVLEWMRGTTLIPVQERLSGAMLDDFTDAYRQRLDQAYPVRADGVTLFPFRRLFMIARV